MMLRRSPVGIVLQRSDGGLEVTAKRGPVKQPAGNQELDMDNRTCNSLLPRKIGTIVQAALELTISNTDD